MAVIVERVFSEGSDKGIVLQNEEWVRPLSIGSSWARLRIGLLCAIRPVDTNNVSAARFLCVGACSGTSAPLGAASTTNFQGAELATAGTPTLTYNAGSGNPYYNCAQYASLWKVAAAETKSNLALAAGHGTWATTTGATQRKFIWVVDLIKNTSVWNTYVPPASNAVNFNPFHCLQATEQAIAQAVTNGVTLSSAGVATAFSGSPSESAGALNCIDILWACSAVPIEIYYVVVYRIS